MPARPRKKIKVKPAKQKAGGPVWETVPELRVRLHWTCLECKRSETVCNPGFLQDSGLPICSGCDGEMNYTHTTVRTD